MQKVGGGGGVVCLSAFLLEVQVETAAGGAGAGWSRVLQAQIPFLQLHKLQDSGSGQGLLPAPGQQRAALLKVQTGGGVNGSGDVPAGSLKKAP